MPSRRSNDAAKKAGNNLTRRELLSGIAAAATIAIVPRHVLGGAGQTAPSDRIPLAGIGIGGVGHGQLQACDRAGFQIVALCDVDDVYAEKSYNRWPQAKRSLTGWTG
ncbi:MAG: hypothetical protein JJ992_15785, partial [Planctomycetes bacterium]|nr:hypothetical protein [Planctomycetota bacterium]